MAKARRDDSTKLKLWNESGFMGIRTDQCQISGFPTAFVVIALALLLHDYLFADYFGIYEDDYIWVMTLPPMSWSFQDLCHTLGEIWSQRILYQGRPLGFSLNCHVRGRWSGGYFDAPIVASVDDFFADCDTSLPTEILRSGISCCHVFSFHLRSILSAFFDRACTQARL